MSFVNGRKKFVAFPVSAFCKASKLPLLMGSPSRQEIEGGS